MRSAFLVAVAIFGVAAEANAQQILSAGTIYGGPAQARAVCYIYNSGATTLRLAGTQLADQNGTVQPLVVNQCGANLGPGTACGITANIAGKKGMLRTCA